MRLVFHVCPISVPQRAWSAWRRTGKSGRREIGARLATFRSDRVPTHCTDMETRAERTSTLTTTTGMETDSSPVDFVRDLDIRRAVLAVLLAAERELSSDDVVDRLRAAHGIDLDGRQKVSPRRRVSDTLRSLERRGWCRRVRRGRYVAVPSAMSPSRRWRSINWRRPSVRALRR